MTSRLLCGRDQLQELDEPRDLEVCERSNHDLGNVQNQS